jgi:hypothetical protein
MMWPPIHRELIEGREVGDVFEMEQHAPTAALMSNTNTPASWA